MLVHDRGDASSKQSCELFVAKADKVASNEVNGNTEVGHNEASLRSPTSLQKKNNLIKFGSVSKWS